LSTLPRILVLGGYGLFGRHVCFGLARLPACEVWVAGRSNAKAAALVVEINAQASPNQAWQAIALDHQTSDFAAQLATLKPNLVIHCGGPFQAQHYHVAEATIACGAHYLDLADSRSFVVGIEALDQAARTAGVAVISGASSVPAISGAVVRTLADQLRTIAAIDIGISPGNRTERGLATVAAILSYVGEAIPAWQNGALSWRRGWLGLRRFAYPKPAGGRFLVDCDVPDLALMPKHFPTLQTLRFGAGLEHPLLHFGLYLLAHLRRFRLLPNLARFATPMQRASEWFRTYGSDCGAMHVRVRGEDQQGKNVCLTWTLIAEHGCGPHVPATPAVAFVARLIAGSAITTGARSALMEFTLEELQRQWQGLAIRCFVAASNGKPGS
jgi:hypothetical protein